MNPRKTGSIFSRFFLSYILIGIVPIIILSGLLYYYNAVFYTEGLKETNINKLIQVKNQIDLDLKVLSDVTYHLSSNTQLLNPDTSKNKNAWDNKDAEITNQLQTYMETCFFLDDILLYNRGSKDVYLTDGRYYYSNFENRAMKGFLWWKASFFIDINTIVAPKIKRINGEAVNQTDKLLAFMYPLPYFDARPSSTIVYIMKEDYILSKFSEFLGDFDGSIFVLDNFYNVLISTSKEIPDTDIDILEDKSSKHKGTGVWDLEVNSTSYVAMRTVSDYNGWSYVVVMPHKQYYSKVYSMRNRFIYITLFLLVAGFMLAFLFSKKNYKPIKSLASYIKNVDANQTIYGSDNELEAIRFSFEKSYSKSRELIVQVNAQRPFVRDQCLIKIINGKVKDAKELDYLLKCANIDLSGAAYFSLVLSTRERGLKNIGIEQLLKLLESIVFAGASGYGVELVQEKAIAVVVSIEAEKDDFRTEQQAIAEDICLLIERNFSVKPVIGIGSVYRDVFQLNTSFLEALSAMYDNLNNFEANVFFFHDIKKSQKQLDWYPVMEQSLYIESLKQGNKTVAIDTLRSMLASIAQGTKSYFMIKCQCFDILNNVFRSINKVDVSSFTYDMDKLTMFRTLEEFREGMELFSSEFCDYMDQWKETRSNELKNNIIRYVNENFTSSSISLDEIAGQFDISSTYVSRFFKDETGLNFIDYITGLRMDYAKKLLRNTDAPIKDIVQEAGYIDASSFSRKFKAMEGVTPLQYREMIQQIR
jgi:two-component system response regulator YesN